MAYFPAKHWDSQADEWDATVANKNFPHYFYYYEADLYIADLLETSRLALELGAGTCGSTIKHFVNSLSTEYSVEELLSPMLGTRRDLLANPTEYCRAAVVSGSTS